MNVEHYLNPLKESFEALADTGNARQMKAYMKDQFEFYGLKAPVRREIQKEFLAQYGKPDKQLLVPLIKELWGRPEREWQMFAMDILDKSQKHWNDDVMSLFEFLITTKSWWDTVDFMAATLVYKHYSKNAARDEALIRRWSQSNNMWLNRTAIIFQLKCKTNIRVDLLEEFILPHIGSKEFFHQKAIGWALRQHSRIDPDWVIDFVDTHPLKPLSRREALRLIMS
jgi:3-methyladenine DNA glycosylase AlkD